MAEKCSGAFFAGRSSFSRYIEAFANAVRIHWGIEASLHHVLDVSFQEDASKIHKENAPENLAVIRHFVISMLQYLPVRKKMLVPDENGRCAEEIRNCF